MGCCLSKTEENQDNCNPNDYEEFQEQCSNQNLNEDVTELGADDNDSGKVFFYISFSEQFHEIAFNLRKSFL